MILRRNFSNVFNTVFLVVLIFVSLVLILFNMDGLEVGRDEGVHAFAAKTLAFEGRYALKDGPAYLMFDRRVAVGPTIIYPTAFLYKVFGFSVITTRIVPGAYFLLFIIFFYLLIKEIFGEKVAFLSNLFILSSQWPFWRDLAIFNPVYRTLTGEAGALFFLVLGLFIWQKSKSQKGKVFSSFILGFSIVTKYQFVLLLLPLFLTSLAFFYKGLRKDLKRAFLEAAFFTGLSLFPLFLWFLYQYLSVKSPYFFSQLFSFKSFGNQAFQLSFFRVKQNIVDKWAELNPNSLRVFYTLPALVFGWAYMYKSDLLKRELPLFVISFPTIWMLWYLFSRGYIRYEIPGLYFSLIFLSLFFVEELKRLKLRSFFILPMLLLILGYGFYINFREAKVVEKKAAKQVALFMDKNLRKSDKVLTSELDYEVDLFLNKMFLYHTPPNTRNLAFQGEYIDPVKLGYSYILAKSKDVTFEYALHQYDWELVFKSGTFNLYKLKDVLALKK